MLSVAFFILMLSVVVTIVIMLCAVMMSVAMLIIVMLSVMASWVVRSNLLKMKLKNFWIWGSYHKTLTLVLYLRARLGTLSQSGALIELHLCRLQPCMLMSGKGGYKPTTL